MDPNAPPQPPPTQQPAVIDLTAEPDSPVLVSRANPVGAAGGGGGGNGGPGRRAGGGWRQPGRMQQGSVMIDLTDDADEAEVLEPDGAAAGGAGNGSNRANELFGMRYLAAGLNGLSPLGFNSLPSISNFFQVGRVRAAPDPHRHRAGYDYYGAHNNGPYPAGAAAAAGGPPAAAAGMRNRRNNPPAYAGGGGPGGRPGMAAIDLDLDAQVIGQMIGDHRDRLQQQQLQYQQQHQHHHHHHQHHQQHHHHAYPYAAYAHANHHRPHAPLPHHHQNPLGGNIPDLNYQMNGLLQHVMGQGAALFDGFEIGLGGGGGGGGGGGDDDKPPYEVPPPAAPGFTRDAVAAGAEADAEDEGGDDMVVCAGCERELVYDPDGDDEPAGGGSGGGAPPAAKRARNRRDREEHHFWAVTECGHVYCKWCFDNRRDAIKGVGVGASDGPRLGFRSTGKGVRCAVPSCEADVTAKKAWVGLFV